MLFQRNLGAKYSPLFLFNAITPGVMAICFYLNIFWMAELSFSMPPSPFVVADLVVNTGYIEALLTVVSLLGFVYYTVLFILLSFWNRKSLMMWRQQYSLVKLFFLEERGTSFLLHLTIAVAIVLFCAGLSLTLPFFYILSDVLYVLLLALSVMSVTHAIKLIAEKGVATNHNDDTALLTSSISLLVLSVLAVGLSTSNSATLLFVLGSFLATCLALSGIIFVAFFFYRCLSVTSESLSPHLICFLTAHVSILPLLVLSFKSATTAHIAQGQDGSQAFLPFIITLSCAIFAKAYSFLSFHAKGLLVAAIQGQHYFVSMLSLILPGLCLLITAHYFIHGILIAANIIDAGSFAYWSLFLAMVALQSFLMLLYSKLNRRLFLKAFPDKHAGSEK